jgi:hypothetical protein
MVRIILKPLFEAAGLDLVLGQRKPLACLIEVVTDCPWAYIEDLGGLVDRPRFLPHTNNLISI